MTADREPTSTIYVQKFAEGAGIEEYSAQFPGEYFARYSWVRLRVSRAGRLMIEVPKREHEAHET